MHIGVTAKRYVYEWFNNGYARYHDDEVSGGEGTNNDKFFASYKVMPNMGVFVTLEDVEVVNTFIAIAGTDGKLNTYGIHYKMGID